MTSMSIQILLKIKRNFGRGESWRMSAAIKRSVSYRPDRINTRQRSASARRRLFCGRIFGAISMKLHKTDHRVFFCFFLTTRLTEHCAGQREIVVHKLAPGNDQGRGGVLAEALLEVDARGDDARRRQRQTPESSTGFRYAVIVSWRN